MTSPRLHLCNAQPNGPRVMRVVGRHSHWEAALAERAAQRALPVFGIDALTSILEDEIWAMHRAGRTEAQISRILLDVTGRQVPAVAIRQALEKRATSTASADPA